MELVTSCAHEGQGAAELASVMDRGAPPAGQFIDASPKTWRTGFVVALSTFVNRGDVPATVRSVTCEGSAPKPQVVKAWVSLIPPVPGYSVSRVSQLRQARRGVRLLWVPGAAVPVSSSDADKACLWVHIQPRRTAISACSAMEITDLDAACHVRKFLLQDGFAF